MMKPCRSYNDSKEKSKKSTDVCKLKKLLKLIANGGRTVFLERREARKVIKSLPDRTKCAC